MRWWRAKPASAIRRTCSSTWWMLTGRALDRRGVAELLHPLDQGADPVGLVADQLDQRPVVLADRRLQELGGAADAGERVLHLVRQRRGEARHRAGRAPVRDLLVEPARHRAGVQHHEHVLRQLGHRAEMAVDADHLAAGQRQLDAIVGDRGARRLYLADERHYRRVRRHELAQSGGRRARSSCAENSCSAAGLAKRKRRLLVDGEHGAGDALQQHAGVEGRRRRRARRGLPRGAHRVAVLC